MGFFGIFDLERHQNFAQFLLDFVVPRLECHTCICEKVSIFQSQIHKNLEGIEENGDVYSESEIHEL